MSQGKASSRAVVSYISRFRSIISERISLINIHLCGSSQSVIPVNRQESLGILTIQIKSEALWCLGLGHARFTLSTFFLITALLHQTKSLLMKLTWPNDSLSSQKYDWMSVWWSLHKCRNRADSFCNKGQMYGSQETSHTTSNSGLQAYLVLMWSHMI